MRAFTVLVTLALSAIASAQQQGQQQGQQGGEQQAPCPPQFNLQCCQHVISAPDASLFKITVDAKTLPGLAATQCATLSPTSQCQSYPVCCKSVQTGFSAGCIPA